MLFRAMEPSKYPHHAIYLFFFFSSCLVNFSFFFKVKQIPLDNKLLSLDPFRKFIIIDLNQPKFHLHFLNCIFLIKFHLSQEQFSLVIILDLKISPSRHISNNLRRVSANFHSAIILGIKGEMPSLIFSIGSDEPIFGFDYFLDRIFV